MPRRRIVPLDQIQHAHRKLPTPAPMELLEGLSDGIDADGHIQILLPETGASWVVDGRHRAAALAALIVHDAPERA